MRCWWRDWCWCLLPGSRRRWCLGCLCRGAVAFAWRFLLRLGEEACEQGVADGIMFAAGAVGAVFLFAGESDQGVEFGQRAFNFTHGAGAPRGEHFDDAIEL